MADGDPVTQEQFYETMNGVKKEVIDKIDIVINTVSDLNREIGEVKQSQKDQDNRVKGCEEKIHDLEKSDRKWAGITGVATGLVNIVISAIMDSSRRG